MVRTLSLPCKGEKEGYCILILAPTCLSRSGSRDELTEKAGSKSRPRTPWLKRGECDKVVGVLKDEGCELAGVARRLRNPILHSR